MPARGGKQNALERKALLGEFGGEQMGAVGRVKTAAEVTYAHRCKPAGACPSSACRDEWGEKGARRAIEGSIIQCYAACWNYAGRAAQDSGSRFPPLLALRSGRILCGLGTRIEYLLSAH